MTQRHGKAPYDTWYGRGALLQARLQTVTAIYDAHDYPDQAARIRVFSEHLDQVFAPVTAASLAVGPLPPPAPGGSHNSHGHSQAVTVHSHEAAELLKLEELAIWHAGRLFTEMLEIFPLVSSDMQTLLGCSWREPNGRRAIDLFKGPIDTNNAGIGSGYVADGGLPASLFELIRAEKSDSSRPPRHRRQWQNTTESEARIAKQKRQSKLSPELRPPWERS